ncbi:leucine-rich repeats and immunoglobulin-like domains protein 1 [Sitodiplosis mosellana]|uniref:leucine-rich repeats and immunoglobulin-like domains protein 1 n=1 Tax=Sitodiplosis mosellana TaxID=263140 RepID=UPI002445002C|nr:leucine-rich repeats and immunoglobulin-like domains protein 1 [Sitodiplosis mosellana]
MTLNASHNNITELNEKTAINLVLLQDIDFSYNQIETLTDLSNISSQLVIVNFSHNKIHYVEANAFQKLSELKLLDLSYNFIRVMPDNVFRNNTKLKELNLENSQINRLWCVECFQNLIHLNVAHNFIAQTRALIEQLGTKVEVLDLTSNYLPVAHFSLFEKCHNLQSLNLSQTHLREIYTDSLSTEWNLRTLDLSNNYLKEIDLKSRGTFKNVIFLYLNGNNLTRLNGMDVVNVPKLELLNISNNSIPCEDLKDFLRSRQHYTFAGEPRDQKNGHCRVCLNEVEFGGNIIRDAEDIINLK